MFKRNDEKKKKQEIIFERKWILWGVWRVLRIFVFRLSFHFSIKMINENAPVCFMKTLCFTWPKHSPTWKHFNCFQQNIDIILINFSVIFRMSSQTLLSKKQSLNSCTFCAINFLAIPTFSKINYGNISQIFQSIICLKWQINSTIYADVAF